VGSDIDVEKEKRAEKFEIGPSGIITQRSLLALFCKRVLFCMIQAGKMVRKCNSPIIRLIIRGSVELFLSSFEF
jgi:hypothetical protein